jgi:hypothetical protein
LLNVSTCSCSAQQHLVAKDNHLTSASDRNSTAISKVTTLSAQSARAATELGSS